jgi:NADPH:quinone reductase-like Zn-dependent oxidoreductase
MQAVRVHEGAELRCETVPDPEPKPGEVLVELRTAALNRRDLLVRKGVYPFPLPLVPGSDGAGIRRDTGEEVVINPGLGWGHQEDAGGPDWEILGGPRNGTYAELIAIPEANVHLRPRQFSWEEAASFPLAALTAYRALFTKGNVHGGTTVLILGAGSGVTTFAVQLAAHVGAHVLVTSSSQEKIDRAVELGAEGGFLYTAGDWAEEARAATGGNGVDVVLDSVGSTWPDSLRALRKGGRAVVFGATGGEEITLTIRPFYLQWLSLLGTTMGSPSDFAALLRMLDVASVRPVIDSVRPLAEAETAQARMAAGEHFGKLVLSIES